MRINGLYLFVLAVLIPITACNNETPTPPDNNTNNPVELLPEIDLNHWKVTLPIGNPTEIEPPEILNYANIDILKEYMFNDTSDGSLVFFTRPGSTTANSSYSRTELREQMEPGSNSVNWTFAQGGILKGRLKVSTVSGPDDNKDRVIVMQIHGRLTNEQRDLIGEDDNNAPPVLKIYWDDGKINVRRKILKDIAVSDTELLKTDSWKDESHWFDTSVGFDEFSIEIKAAANLLEVQMGDEVVTFDDVHVEKWAVFENYFKAGNYLQSTKSTAYAQVKFYELEVHH